MKNVKRLISFLIVAVISFSVVTSDAYKNVPAQLSSGVQQTQTTTIADTQEKSPAPSDAQTKISDESTQKQNISLSKNDIVYEPKEDSITVIDDDCAYVNDVITVFLKDGITEDEKNEIISSIGGEVVGFTEVLGQYQVSTAKSSLEEINALADSLMEDERVEYASASVASLVDEQSVYDDPWGGNANWDDEFNPSFYNNWWIRATDTDKAWDYDEYFNDITVGIVDSGFDTEHEDLEGKISFPKKWLERQNVADNHGTHVAGIIAAQGGNGIGLAGIVQKASLSCVDWQPAEDTSQWWITDERILTGLAYNVMAGAKVINFSLGSSGSLKKKLERSKFLVNLEGAFTSFCMAKLISKGYDFVVVQSAGNGMTLNSDGLSYAIDAINNGTFCTVTKSNCFTGLTGVSKQDILDRIIVVASAQVTSTGYMQSSFSNGGSQVSICAPGSSVYSCYNGSTYGTMSGTSMAAPVVTGITALAWSVNPSLSGAQVKSIVCDESNTRYEVADSTSERHLPTGTMRMVNAELAVKAAAQTLENQGKVKGNVVYTKFDIATCAAIKITDENGAQSFMSVDSNGLFEINLAPGEYEMTVTKDKYEETISFAVESGETTDLGKINLYAQGTLKDIKLIESIKNLFK